MLGDGCVRAGIHALTACAGIYGAGDGLAFAQPGHATLIAAHAWDDRIVMVRGELVGQIGVGDERPPHDHEIGLAGIEDGVGGFPVDDAPGHAYKGAISEGFLDRGGAVGVPALGQAGRRAGETVCLAKPHADVEQIDAVVRHCAGDVAGQL